ncbi:PiggyBac transposable element-derived protein 3, partial [Blattella germanica]
RLILRYWKKLLTLHELLEEVEKLDSDPNIPEHIDITIFPPDNSNNDNTDEESGEEENVNINNLPGSQLRVEAELLKKTNNEENVDNSEGSYSDNIPSTSGVKRKRKSLSQRKVSNTQSDWRINDICSDMPSWKNVVVCQNQLSPVDTFFLFFDDEVIDMLVDYTNRYAALHNREGDIQPNEMRCFFAILLLSGYTNVSRREMYWENALDSNNPLVCNAMSRNRFRFIMQNIHCNDNNGLNKDDSTSHITSKKIFPKGKEEHIICTTAKLNQEI